MVDVGLKAVAVDSGLPLVWQHPNLSYTGASDEHGKIVVAPGSTGPALGEKLRLVPGHCDPTVDRYDWYVGVRGWPRGVPLAGDGARRLYVIRHIHRCNSFVGGGAWHRLRLDATPVGWVRSDIASFLQDFGGTLAGDTVGVDLAGLHRAARHLAEAGLITDRQEAFDIRADNDGRVLGTIDRGALWTFGLQIHNAHLNALVRRPDGLHLWVSRRAAHKAVAPGKLDHPRRRRHPRRPVATPDTGEGSRGGGGPAGGTRRLRNRRLPHLLRHAVAERRAAGDDALFRRRIARDLHAAPGGRRERGALRSGRWPTSSTRCARPMSSWTTSTWP